MRRISEATKSKIFEHLEAGDSASKIAGIFNIFNSTVYRIGKEKGFKFKEKKIITEEQKTEIVSRIKNGERAEDIALIMDVGVDYVHKTRRSAGIKPKRGGANYTEAQKTRLFKSYFEEGCGIEEAARKAGIVYATAADFVRHRKKELEKPVRKKKEPRNIGYLREGLKEYSKTQLIQMWNMTRANKFEGNIPMMKLGRETYGVDVVIETIKEELDKRGE